jgi:TPR repeat protein
MTTYRKRAAILVATFLFSPISARADWNQNNDEANRQRIMSDMRQTQSNNDRANADAQFKAQNQRQPTSTSTSGNNSSGGNSSSSGAYVPSSGDDTDYGQRQVVSTTTVTVGATETAEGFFARTSKDAGLGYAKSQYDLGRMYYAGYGAARDDSQARRWLGEAAKQGHAVSAALYASILRYGIGGPVDIVEARKNYEIAAKGGDARAMAELGMMHMMATGGLPQNNAEAVRLWTTSSGLGDSSALYALGLANINGMAGLSPNPKEGLRLVKASAEKGDLNGMTLYARVLHEGAIVPKDVQAAIRYARAAGEGGDGAGQSMMAIYYYLGDGVPQSFDEAARWAKLSAASGNAEGQTTLGTMYYLGQGVPKDIKEATRWFIKSAAQGHEMAISNMKEPDIIEAAKGL